MAAERSMVGWLLTGVVDVENWLAAEVVDVENWSVKEAVDAPSWLDEESLASGVEGVTSAMMN